MKISLITRHAISNYGSFLQAFATQMAVKKLGHECEIIDYIRDDERPFRQEYTLLRHKSKWNNNPITKAAYLTLRTPESILAGVRFGKQRKKFLNLSSRYSSLNMLKTKLPVADIYMTGSDQVWGPMANGELDSAYCLSFVPDNAKKISYGASFGRADMTDEEKAYFKNRLSKYKALAVREDSAVGILSDLGLEAKQVLDPTLLLTYDEWQKLVDKNERGCYVLIYQLHNNPKLGVYAKKVAEEKNLSLIRISPSLHQCIREGKFIWCPPVDEFLSLIKNAKCLITDSFHGTAFAITFHTPFIDVLPNNNTETRNMSILRMTGLSDRILKDDGNTESAWRAIDYMSVDEILRSKRLESYEILKMMLEN